MGVLLSLSSREEWEKICGVGLEGGCVNNNNRAMLFGGILK